VSMEFANGREPTAIVIDDDKPTTLFLKRLLRMMDVDVLAIGSDGKDAVRLYEKYKPDIVFTDILMPENDGFYAIEEIRKFDSYAKTSTSIILSRRFKKSVVGLSSSITIAVGSLPLANSILTKSTNIERYIVV